MHVVAFTGHRPPRLGGYGSLNPVRAAVMKRLGAILVERGFGPFAGEAYCGMAQGFDQWAAEVCLDRQIPFIAAVPFQGYEKLWPPAAQAWVRYLCGRAARVHYVSQGGQVRDRRGAALACDARNRWMVDRADLLISCWDGEPGGGTWNTLQYAKAKGLPSVNIDPWALGGGTL